MTEYLLNLNTGNSGAPAWTSYTENEKWGESLGMLETIHYAMIHNWNAYIWWYIQRYYSFIGDGEQGTVNGSILKRGYAFSHFSKYVRPGFVRIHVITDIPTGLEITAYKGDNQVVIVVLNQYDFQKNGICFEVPYTSGAIAYETSVTCNRSNKEVSLTDGKFVTDISGRSITTFLFEK